MAQLIALVVGVVTGLLALADGLGKRLVGACWFSDRWRILVYSCLMLAIERVVQITDV